MKHKLCDDIQEDMIYMSGQAQHSKNNGRIIYLSGVITERTAVEVNSQLLALHRENLTSDITMIIDSYGGELFAAFAIVDMMNIISCDIRTICVGKAMSAGQFIFSSGTKGKRFMSRFARLMIHNPIVGIEGPVPDVEVEIEEIMETRDIFIKHISQCSKLSFDEVKDLVARNKYLGVDAAIKYGFADSVITKIR